MFFCLGHFCGIFVFVAAIHSISVVVVVEVAAVALAVVVVLLSISSSSSLFPAPLPLPPWLARRGGVAVSAGWAAFLVGGVLGVLGTEHSVASHYSLLPCALWGWVLWSCLSRLPLPADDWNSVKGLWWWVVCRPAWLPGGTLATTDWDNISRALH